MSRKPTPERRSFKPVPVSPRRDGWTPEKQAAFIEALTISSCVTRAAESVGMSRESAYQLRTRRDAEAFRDAWELALLNGVHRLGEAALERSLNGVPVPIFYKGKQVGERRHFDERLTQFLLRTRDPLRYTFPLEKSQLVWRHTLDDLARWLANVVAALRGGTRLRPPNCGDRKGDVV